MLRRRLLGNEAESPNGQEAGGASLHHSTKHGREKTRDDIASIMSEEERHENLAGELLKLTGQMKENFTLARSVLKEDNLVAVYHRKSPARTYIA